jgi:hypothetical protein
MPDHLTFGDIEGKLDVLVVECARCDRKGRYNVARLIEQHGRDGTQPAPCIIPFRLAKRAGCCPGWSSTMSEPKES